MLGVAPYILTVALLIAPVASSQANVGCDLISTQTPNLNVMTTQTQTVMGKVPQDSATIVTTDPTTFTPGSTVTLTFGANFGRGVVQATDGTFAAQSQFTVATTCVGTATAMYKDDVGATNPVTWTAPATGTTVTLNVIGTTAYGQTYRRIVTLTAAPTTTIATTTAATSTAAPTSTAAAATTTAAPTTTAMVDESHGAYHAYTASISQLGNSGVSGEVTVFVTQSGLIGIGSASGLEANLTALSNCTAGGACGTHIHSGSACTDTSTQGGHFYDMAAADPWGSIKYGSTSSAGSAMFSFEMTTSAKDIDGKTFIVHNNAGARVACGIFSHAATTSTELMPLVAGNNVTGSVTIYVSSSMIVAAGWVSGLEVNLADSTKGGSDCVQTNACGTHVHSGSGCGSADQGGHLQTSTGQDPWSTIRYSSTNAQGHATVLFHVQSDRTEVQGKPFIVHNNAGARVSCGLLSADAHTTTTGATATEGTTTVGVVGNGTTTQATNSEGGGNAQGQVSNSVATAVSSATLLLLASLQ